MEHSNKRDNFDTIVHEYHKMVFRTAMGFVHNKEDAEDLTQEVFLKAYKRWDSFRGDSKVSTWLYRIAINCSLNFMNTPKAIFTQIEELFNIKSTRATINNTPHHILEQKELKEKITKAVDSLPERQRTAFVLSKYEELSQKEIAEVMQLSEGAIEQLLVRAKTKLKQKLSK